MMNKFLKWFGTIVVSSIVEKILDGLLSPLLEFDKGNGFIKWLNQDVMFIDCFGIDSIKVINIILFIVIFLILFLVLKIIIKKRDARKMLNGHEYVDLGLSVKWATCNVGASSPEEYGDYFAWGETEPKEEYTEENSVTYGDASIGNIAGDSRYDAARVNWGSSWRLPTIDEMKELLENCKHKWVKQNGVEGRLFTSKKNGKSIFLPAAGYRNGSSLNDAGENGRYWSASPYESNSYCAYRLGFDSGGAYWLWLDRYYGRSIRPVSE